MAKDERGVTELLWALLMVGLKMGLVALVVAVMRALIAQLEG